MPETNFIYFDLGNVLLNFSHEIACRNLGELANISSDVVRQLVFEADLELAYERGDLTTQEFYERFCSGTGTQPEIQALCHAASNIFSLNESVMPIVDRLQSKGHRLGILSNTCEAHWEFCQENYPQLRRFFPVHALSFRLRSLKPEPGIYQAAAELAATHPQKIFFTDDRADNVQGAKEAGYDAVLFHSAEQLEEELKGRGLL